MNLLSATAAIFLTSVSFALAATDTPALVASYQAQGYTNIEVREGPTQTKIEAVLGTTKVETIYDRTSGAVLKSETEIADASDLGKIGVSVRARNKDFIRTAATGSDDPEMESEDADDHGGKGRGRGGRDKADDHDNDDDNGGDDDHDDSGSDDSGSDDD